MGDTKCRSGTRSEWLAIAEACQAATEPDRALDVKIAASLDVVSKGFRVRTVAEMFPDDCAIRAEATGNYTWLSRATPPYTASLDAITAAIGPEMTWEVLSTGWARIEEPGRGFDGVAATPALALCAAFARAMAAKARSDALSELAAMDGEHL